MGKLTQSLEAGTEALREAYAALNRNDIPAMLKAFDPQIERIEPPKYPAGGTYRGHAAVEAHISKARETWAEGSCEPEQFIVASDKIVAFLYVRGLPWVQRSHNAGPMRCSSQRRTAWADEVDRADGGILQSSVGG
jgi:ketosteroid isomerase-like protein